MAYNIVAVTACPSGVAHTYLSAEALEVAAKKHDLINSIKVETQSSMGTDNKLTSKEIENADVVILTKDIAIKGRERFAGKPIIQVMTSTIIKKGTAVINKAIEVIENK